MDDAIRRAAPSPRRPVRLRSRGPASPSTPTSHGSTRCGPGPTGVATSRDVRNAGARLKRRERLEVEAAIERWKQTLPSLSRQQRDGTVQVAMDGMKLPQGLRRRVTALAHSRRAAAARPFARGQSGC